MYVPKKNNFFVCLLDVSKAFDSVPHDSIKRALMKNGCPSEFVDLINNQYENSYTALLYTDRSSQVDSYGLRIRRWYYVNRRISPLTIVDDRASLTWVASYTT
jgi:hypothetical protein